MTGPTKEQRAAARRKDPMGDDAAEAALLWLNDNASSAGKAKADVTYLEHWRKVVLNRLKRASTEKSDAAREVVARSHPDYEAVLVAQHEAIVAYEAMYWKRIAAEATLDAWRTRNANERGAGRMQ
jgi:hypothetical protein